MKNETKNMVLSLFLLVSLIISTLGVRFFPQLHSSMQESPLDKEKKVFAFYYNWYQNQTNYSNASLGINDTGNGWGWGGRDAINWTDLSQIVIPTNEQEVLNQTFRNHGKYTATAHLPVRAGFDSQDPDKLREDFLNSAYAGIDVLITNWWGPGWSSIAFNNCLNYARYLEVNESIQNIPQFTIYFENNRPDPSNTWPSGYGERERAIADELIYMVKTFGNHPKFFKMNGIPVLFIWAPIDSGMTWERWYTVRQMVEKEVGKVYMHAMLHYNLNQKGYQEATGFFKIFDGYHMYIASPLLNNIGDETRARSFSIREFWTDQIAWAKKMGVNFAPSVEPGYDDRFVKEKGDYKNRRGTVQYGEKWTYAGMWEDAIASGARWICITTYNEWWEGTEIDASFEYGNFFIEMTRNYTQQFKS